MGVVREDPPRRPGAGRPRRPRIARRRAAPPQVPAPLAGRAPVHRGTASGHDGLAAEAASLPAPCPTPPRRRRPTPAMAVTTRESRLFPGQVVQPIDLASTLRHGGGARPGHRHRPAAGAAVAGRPAGGPRALAAQPLHRADLLPPRRAGPGDQRPGPDGPPRLAVPRHDGDPGQQLPRAAAGERLPAAERPERRCCGSPTRSIRPAAARRVIAANQAGRRRRRPTTPCWRHRRRISTSSSRPERSPSPARPPATPRTWRPSPAPTPVPGRAWRPTTAAS